MTAMTNTASPGLETEELRDALDTVISIPVVPFRNGEVDFEGHATNVDYLMNNNNLEGGGAAPSPSPEPASCTTSPAKTRSA